MKYIISTYDLIGTAIAFISLGFGLAWYFSEGGYEAFIALFGGLSGLVLILNKLLHNKSSPADQERFKRLAFTTPSESLKWLDSHDFGGFYSSQDIRPFEEFVRLSKGIHHILLDQELESLRKEAERHISEFLSKLGSYTTMEKHNLYAISREMKHLNHAKFREMSNELNKLASTAHEALEAFLVSGLRKFPEVYLEEPIYSTVYVHDNNDYPEEFNKDKNSSS
jgi:hypothetical protein